ncbi:hypothetical protein Q4E93_19310 [Flavitalea sp. BT771]|uniref:hypothetical protein n=1 Tax=Flavitalea sp. BT771 TaxID=3063329 RepID=UPI0026E1F7DB|nr:hypothetical protein [Flavitalea sp. BT771]MDO6432764.1 hypothetical protein [Flavitalea sp. BT771]MDV6221960.1 hypothetical protein [Flavitalea sp. BT771]
MEIELLTGRRILFWLSILSLVCLNLSCGGNNSSAAQRSGGDSLIKTRNDTALSLTGVWVNKAYLDTLLATGSPRAAISAAREPCIEFRSDTDKYAHIVFNFHEGEDEKILQKGGKYTMGDSGEIMALSPEEIRIGHQYFVRFKHPDREKYDYNIVEELLFAGNYQLENGAKVSFSGDGRVYGLDSMKYFTPNVDYIGPGLDVDQLWLGMDSDVYKSPKYAFKFISDTLLLYKLNCLEGYDSTDNSCGVVDFGQLKWKLIRKK